MSAREPVILRALAAIGVQVVLVDGKLRARGATSRLTSAHLAAIRMQRAALRAWLAVERDAQILPFVPMLLGGEAPNAQDWAIFFRRYPDELVRLAPADAVPQLKLPAGKASTPVHWAAYFASNPDELERLSVLAAERLRELAAERLARSKRSRAELNPAANGALVPLKVY